MESLLMSEAYKKLIKTLQNIFEMDKADLDFGIYRIMNQKRDEINKFLNEDLLPQIKKAFEDFANKSNKQAHDELENFTKTLEDAGMDPDSSPKVLELKKQISNSVDNTALESDVFSKLHTFFSRYYDKGDFISQRRYKPNTYAIPYEGEEVKLYWANHDQYYIKSSEHLRDYAFIAKDGQDNDQPFRIKLVEADTEKDNIKEKSNEERRFVLNEDQPLSIENGELIIHFNFIPVGKKDQKKLNEGAVKTIFNQTDKEFNEWLHILKKPDPTEKNKDRTLLEKHIHAYTARNTFDYFIHKNLGDFLRRELDFFIKNEVLHLDDIDDNSFELTEQQLRKIKILRTIAHKIIRMLAQIEDFQKKLWLKKKFVVETNYCITLDLVPQNLIPEIIKNKQQREEWKNLFSLDLDKFDNDFNSLKLESFLKSEDYAYLIIDTKYMQDGFKDKLLSSIQNINETLNGELINSDNFHALSLLINKYENKIKCIYIDPPYNTSSTPILYKNEYKDSSWLSLMDSRLSIAKSLLRSDGVKTIAIDDTEVSNLGKYLEDKFINYRISKITVVHNPKGSITKDFNRVHEYALFITHEDSKNCITRTLEENKNLRKLRRWGENSLRIERKLSFYPIYIKDGKIVRIGEVPPDDFHPSGRNIHLASGEIEVWPIDQNGVERRWNFGLDSIVDNLNRIAVEQSDDSLDLFVTHELTVPKTVWSGGQFDAGKYGNSLLINILGEKKFDFPKSIYTVKSCINLITADYKNAVILDYFAGSGTTGHATVELNREDNGTRKYILVEMGKHFSDVILPRMKKIIYSKDWENAKPKCDSNGRLNSVSQFFKYIRLESYEDTLNNLTLSQNTQGRTLLDLNSNFREDYMLGYFMDIETSNSTSILDIEQFEDPFNYKLNISSSSAGVTKPTTIDLIETFNYLIGLKVKTIDVIRDFKIITGTNPKDEMALIVWRRVKEKDNIQLEEFLDKQGYNPRDTEFQHIYINGDHTLEDPHSKVKMIEIEFKRLMFDVKDI